MMKAFSDPTQREFQHRRTAQAVLREFLLDLGEYEDWQVVFVPFSSTVPMDNHSRWNLFFILSFVYSCPVFKFSILFGTK